MDSAAKKIAITSETAVNESLELETQARQWKWNQAQAQALNESDERLELQQCARQVHRLDFLCAPRRGPGWRPDNRCAPRMGPGWRLDNRCSDSTSTSIASTTAIAGESGSGSRLADVAAPTSCVADVFDDIDSSESSVVVHHRRTSIFIAEDPEDPEDPAQDEDEIQVLAKPDAVTCPWRTMREVDAVSVSSGRCACPWCDGFGAFKFQDSSHTCLACDGEGECDGDWVPRQFPRTPVHLLDLADAVAIGLISAPQQGGWPSRSPRM